MNLTPEKVKWDGDAPDLSPGKCCVCGVETKCVVLEYETGEAMVLEEPDAYDLDLEPFIEDWVVAIHRVCQKHLMEYLRLMEENK